MGARHGSADSASILCRALSSNSYEGWPRARRMINLLACRTTRPGRAIRAKRTAFKGPTTEGNRDGFWISGERPSGGVTLTPTLSRRGRGGTRRPGMGSPYRVRGRLRLLGNDDWGAAPTQVRRGRQGPRPAAPLDTGFRRYDGWVEGEEGEGKGERRRGFVSGGALLFVDGFPFRREWRFNSAAAAPNRPPRSMFVCPVCLLAAGC